MSLSPRSFCLTLVTFALLAPFLAHADVLENPGNGQHYSGIGVISGWKCEADGALTVRFNGGAPLPLAYHNERADTASVCGDANNGFVAIWNWGNIGDGEHTAVVYDDGVEFARSTFTVGTAGTAFIRGAQASVTVQDFPSPGERQEFEWNQSTQHLEMVSPDRTVVAGTGRQSPGATLENPTHGLNYSGIGVVSGWKCEADGTLTVRFNGGAPLPLAYHNERADTASVCGDANNGFVAIWNWGNIGDGEHTAVVYDDGVEFARSTFTVGTTGEAFLRGASALVTVEGVPSAGQTMEFEWNQNTQHLEMGGIGGGDSTDLGGTRQSPTPVGVNASTPGNLETSTDEDYFEIVVSEAGTLTVETTGSTDTIGVLEDGTGTRLALSDNRSATDRNFQIVQQVQAGTYAVKVTGGNGATGAYTLAVRFTPVLSFGSASIADQHYTQDTPIAALTLPAAMGGTAPLTYSLSPALPAGLHFTPSTRVLAGTPTSTLVATLYTYTVTDASGATATLSFSLSVAAAQPAMVLSFGSASIAAQHYTQDTAIPALTLPAATGGTAPLTYSLNPALPAGLRFDSRTRVLTGTPTVSLAATTYTYTVTDASGATATLSFSLSVAAAQPAMALSFGSVTIADQRYTQNMSIAALTLPVATGGTTPLTYSLSPALPAGLRFNQRTRVIAGTPTVTQAATTYTYTVTDAASATATLSFTLTVMAPPALSFGAATIADQHYTKDGAIAALTLPAATGGLAPRTYSLNPALPAGLRFDPHTRVLEGTPTVTQAATTYTYTVTDAANATATLSFTLTVVVPPAEVTNSVGIELVLIPAGTFQMGSPESERWRYDDEGPVHQVTISAPFYLGKYEVTQAQWRAVMGTSPSYHSDCDTCPVEEVSWGDVQAFIAQLNSQEGVTTYRLPSEAEWEYAARAGTQTAYYFGDADNIREDDGANGLSTLNPYAWHYFNSDNRPHQVGQKHPNMFGLYDVYGNVREWVQDCWNDSYRGASTDGSARVTKGCSNYVRRGGSFTEAHASDLRSARRGYYSSGGHLAIGFRIARTLP